MSEFSHEQPSNPNEGEKLNKNLLWLLTREQFDQLPDGTELTHVFGGKIVKGSINDFDERDGFLAFGFLDKDKPRNLHLKANGLINISEIIKRHEYGLKLSAEHKKNNPEK
jgi:hypothetical protein